MKHCPNVECPARARGMPEFRDEIADCPRCGSELIVGEEPEDLGRARQTEYKELVEVARFQYTHQAELAAAHLKAAGIDAVLADHNIVALEAALSNLFGGAKVLVPPDDIDYAHEVLAGDIPDEAIPGAGPYRGGQTLPDEDGCPECGSHDLAAPERSWWRTLIAILLLGLLRPKTICRACGHAFHE